jgi:PAS domain-containing protein
MALGPDAPGGRRSAGGGASTIGGPGAPDAGDARSCVPSADDIALLLDRTRRGGILGLRNRALVGVLAFCGLRVREALALRVQDVSIPDASLRVRAGDAPRVVSLSPGCVEGLGAWLEERRRLPGRDADGLFVTREGARLAPSYVRQLLSRLSRQAGLTVTVSPEALRRAHARELVERGWPMEEIRLRLGYATQAAARRFLRGAGLPVSPGAGGASEASTDARLSATMPCATCFHGGGLESATARTLLADAPDAVLDADREGRIRSANRAAEILFGAGPQGLVGTSLWDLLHDPCHERLEAAARACLASRRPSWAVDDGTCFGEGRFLARVIPTTTGIALWIRDDLALGGMTGLAGQLSSFAYGGSPGSVILLRAVRDAERAIVDFVVAAIHGRTVPFDVARPEDALRRPVSGLLDPSLARGLTGQLADLIATRRPRRVRLRLGRGDGPRESIDCWLTRLADDWVAIATKRLGDA